MFENRKRRHSVYDQPGPRLVRCFISVFTAIYCLLGIGLHVLQLVFGLLRVTCCICELLPGQLTAQECWVVVPDRIAQTQNFWFSLGRSSCLSPNRSGAESVIRTTIRFVLGTTWCFEAAYQTDGGYTRLDGRRFHASRRMKVSHDKTSETMDLLVIYRQIYARTVCGPFVVIGGQCLVFSCVL